MDNSNKTTTSPATVANHSPATVTPRPNRLLDKHLGHCCGTEINQGQRSLHPDWVKASCYSVEAHEATTLLGYEAKSGGIVIQGMNGQYQFRPDKPWGEKIGKKAPKYRTARNDDYDAMLPAHPENHLYWLNIEELKQSCWQINGHPYLLITEGGFKAIAACSHGIPTIALLGVEMGLTPSKADPQGKRYLVPTLERYAKEGFGFILAFDADVSTKREVRKALYKLGFQLKKFGVPVSVLPQWDENRGKGIDDYIQMSGIEEFREQLLSKAIRFQDWNGCEDSPTIPPGHPASWNSDPIAQWMVDRYRDKLAWDVSIQDWRRYGAEIEGIWSIEPVEFVRQVIYAELEANRSLYTVIKGERTVEAQITDSLIRNIEALMKYKLAVRSWDETEGLIPLTNGVFNLETKKLTPHNPNHRLTWCLPYDYNPLALCNPIQEWLLQVCRGDENLVQLLRAYLYGIVTGRTDWQKYLELIGPGGTGKSTYIRLAIALVGQRNVHTTTLKKLEGGRFETANLKDKRLVIVTDSDRYADGVSTLKAITGQDSLPFEQKFKQAKGGFTPTAMVIVAANEIIQSADYTSGLARRRVSVPMTYRVDENEQKNLIEHRNDKVYGEFVPYISGLFNWVLGIDPHEAAALIKNYRHRVPCLNLMKAMAMVETNPIADWLDHAIIYRDRHRTAVGVAKRDKNTDSDNWYSHTNEWLYANYAQYCHDTGSRAVGVRRFVNLLNDLCVNQLRLSVEHGRDRNGAYFLGLKIRGELDTDPLLITGDNKPPSPPDDHGGGGGNSPIEPDNSPTDGGTGETIPTDAGACSDGLVLDTEGGLSPSVVESDNCSNAGMEIVDSERPSVHKSSKGFAPDYSSYPHRSSDNLRAKEKRALKCKKTMLACTNRDELNQFKSDSGFSDTEIKWVYNHALTASEKAKVVEASSVTQPDLLGQSPALSWDELMAAIDTEIGRLGWSREQAIDYLHKTYGVCSRLQLSNEQVVDFYERLKSL
ncbi:MAG: hypothetical protein N5P05_004089 (plasmid) [Chroococcopsis gigantea SAG 12.99]|jgi:putative DNA primase/helicase|nr:hypothetical protein [Chroococcopsis gigantea SAG 12.99]